MPAPPPHPEHVTVLLDDAVDALVPRPGGTYIDGTFGGGGHTSLLLQRLDGDATIFAFDADPAAIGRAADLAATPHGRGIVPVHANFRYLRQEAATRSITAVDGVLLDLGLSSFQLDTAERGFSFRFDGPLDMRFDPTTGPSAADLVNSLPADELATILWRYGEEPRSRQIARAIEAHRQQQPILRTADLAQLIERTLGGRRGKATHPATRSFQALRIAVNDELQALTTVLATAVDLLRPGGRLVVIAFHSLEDRIVKQFLADESRACTCPPHQPVCTCDHRARMMRVGKPRRPSDDEISANPRSRSAIMRVGERLPDA